MRSPLEALQEAPEGQGQLAKLEAYINEIAKPYIPES